MKKLVSVKSCISLSEDTDKKVTDMALTPVKSCVNLTEKALLLAQKPHYDLIVGQFSQDDQEIALNDLRNKLDDLKNYVQFTSHRDENPMLVLAGKLNEMEISFKRLEKEMKSKVRRKRISAEPFKIKSRIRNEENLLEEQPSCSSKPPLNIRIRSFTENRRELLNEIQNLRAYFEYQKCQNYKIKDDRTAVAKFRTRLLESEGRMASVEYNLTCLEKKKLQRESRDAIERLKELDISLSLRKQLESLQNEHNILTIVMSDYLSGKKSKIVESEATKICDEASKTAQLDDKSKE